MNVVRDLDCAYVDEHDLVNLYVSNQLPESDAEKFEKHYFGCDRCWEQVYTAEHYRSVASENGKLQQISPPKRPARQTWIPWLVAASLTIAAAAGVLFTSSRRADADLGALIRAAGPVRVSTARLSGGFRYASVVRSADTSARAPITSQLQLASLRAVVDAESRQTAAAYHASGVAHLFLAMKATTSADKESEWDKAVADLERARERAPSDSRIWNDLSVAYYTRAGRSSGGADLPRAYEAAMRAEAIEPTLLSARFNLALVLEELGHREEALKEWIDYLKLDSSSDWAHEADQHRRALTEATQSIRWEKERDLLHLAAVAGSAETVDSIVARYAQEARQYLEDTLLTQWASASPEASRSILAEAQNIARALQRLSGESLGADAVDLILQKSADPKSEDFRRLRDGHKAFGQARALYKSVAIPAAVNRFHEAESHFRFARSPFAHLAVLGQASCDLYGLDAARARPRLEAVRAAASRPPIKYRALLAQALWVQGLIEAVDGRLYESLQSYRESLGLFERLHELENTAVLHGLIAIQLHTLGQSEESWPHRIAAIRLLDGLGSPALRVTNALGDLARISSGEGFVNLARLADDRAVRVADAQSIPLFRSYARIWRAQLAERQGWTVRAAADLNRAESECAQISDPSTRDRAEAEIALVALRLASKSDRPKAIRLADQAIQFARRVQDHGRLPALLLIRGRLYKADRRADAADRDFREGIEELERSRSAIDREHLRISYFETGRDLVDEAIALAQEAGDAGKSFRLAEGAHARALLDAVQRSRQTTQSGTTARPLTDVGSPASYALADHEALVEFWLSHSQSVAWAVRRGGIHMIAIPKGNDAFAHQVDNLARLRDDGRPTHVLEEALGNLYDELLRPLEPYLADASRITIIPDGPLATIPFAALRDQRRSRYLVEKAATSVSPSAALSELAGRRGFEKPIHILAAANPRTDRSRFPNLPSLPGSAAEGDAVREYFPAATVLADQAATKSALSQAIHAADSFHFAGHAIVALGNPGYSALVFTPDAVDRADSGLLYAHELASWRLSNLRLVVLAGCKTNSGDSSRSEGTQGIARAFLVAGVPNVIATKRDIEDNAAVFLIRHFYQALSEGQAPDEALRAAQLACARANAFPSAKPLWWADFELLRG